MTNAEWIALGTFAYTVLGSFVGLTWGVGRVARNVERSMRADMVQDYAELDNEFNEFRSRREEADRVIYNRMSDMETAVNKRITEVEFYVRDNYVSNDMLDKIVDLFGKNMTLQFEALKSDVKRLEVMLQSR